MLITFSMFQINIPNFSNKRISFENHRDYLSYDRLSQREIFDAICIVVGKKFITAEKRCWKLAILPAFEKWRALLLNCLKDRPITTYRPRLQIARIPIKSFHEKGARIVHRLLWCQWWLLFVRNRFIIWKYKALEICRLKRRFFDKWNVKSARWKLNRLTGIRFLYLARSLETYLRLLLQQNAIRKWKAMSNKIQVIRWLRVIFRCWKTVIIAKCMAQRSLKNDALNSLKLLCERERMIQNIMIRRVQGRLAIRTQGRSLALWLKLYRTSRILRRLCYRGSVLALYKYWTAWKQGCSKKDGEDESNGPVVAYYQGNVAILPVKASTYQKATSSATTIPIRSKEIGSRKISYQSRDCSVVYKRYVKVPRQQGPAAAKVKVVYTPTTSYQPKTPEQRAQIRLESLKKFENDFILEEIKRRGAKNMKGTRHLL